MTPLRGKVAFVTGANGITGNALVEHLIRQPESDWYVQCYLFEFHWQQVKSNQ